ncbi:MAG: hypothetical protein WBI07_04425 [Mobilitalea sp.]
MKKKVTFWNIAIILVLVIIIGIIVGPMLYWRYQPETSLNVWILDKTVPADQYREHMGIMWELNHEKILNKKTENPFVYAEDYYGFKSLGQESYEITELPSNYEQPNLIYLADTYGIHTSDGYTTSNTAADSELVYGGMNSEDLFAIRNNLANGTTIIGEFNILQEPTDSGSREELEKIFGINWTGWAGKYYDDLTKDIEVSSVMIDQYEKNEHTTWNYSDSGYVLASSDGQVIVLQDEVDINAKGLTIVFGKEYQREFQVEEKIPYYNWFEIITTKLGKETIATYEMDLTASGQKLLEDSGLTTSFPAITRFANTQYTAYYFAGDYAEMITEYDLCKYYKIENINRILADFREDKAGIFYWNCYVPLMHKILGDVKEKTADTQREATQNNQAQMTAKAEGTGFQIMQGGKWKDITIKGVNIGAALPGKWFTEFPTDEMVYYKWFEQIGAMNANTIRIYTLLPPEFYTALDYYNLTHPDQLLWLFQEIWPEEEPADLNYLNVEYEKAYKKEIENVINAVHGTARIDERVGRAYGIYTADISEYIIGYLVGRELDPEEVSQTDILNDEYVYTGTYLSTTSEASATEGWLAMNCDYAVEYEFNYYNWQHPVAIVSWPTLDVTEHDSEWNATGDKSLLYNDKESVDINHISITEELKAGFFGAYHIYPNYPDFINNESKYADYEDEEGTFRYGGYLQEFIASQSKYPALVAEFGIATGMGNAHNSMDGYHHGGQTEQAQGEGIVRMMKAIENENYAGGIIFEWMDEWAKKTWITEPYMIPYERHIFWHNIVDPEQNYGIMAMESAKTSKKTYAMVGTEEISSVELSQDESYLYLNVTLAKEIDFTTERLYIGLDTYGRDSGEYQFNPELNTSAPFGLEFVLDIKSLEDAKLLVHPGYNITKGLYSSYSSSDGFFEEISMNINPGTVTKDGTKIDASYHNCSILNYGDLTDNNYYNWNMEDNIIMIRIPWNRLNFTDPSEMRVLYDEKIIKNPIRDEIGTVITDGIMISVNLVDAKANKTKDILNSETPYQWESWTTPNYVARLKSSYQIIQKYFETIQ